MERIWQANFKKNEPDRRGEKHLTTTSEQLNTTMDETLPPLRSSVQPLATNDADIDKALEQILTSSGGKGDTTTAEEEEEEEAPEDIHHLHVPINEAFPPSPDTILNLAPNQRHMALPPIGSSMRTTPSTLHRSDPGSLPPLTSSPLSSPLHRPPSLTPLSKTDLKLPASLQQPEATPAYSKEEERNLSHFHPSKADDKGRNEFPKELPMQLQLETHPDNKPPLPPSHPHPPLAKEDISLNDEALSELSEELSDISSYDDDAYDQPLMRSDGLKTLENINLVISDDNDEGEDFNKMTETDYEQRKKEMEEKFQSQRIKPGDPGFVYDKEVEFPAARLESGWDSDDDSDPEF